MPRSVLDSFKVGNKKNSVYVNTHYQHFEKTIEESHFREKTRELTSSVAAGITEAYAANFKRISEIEKTFLKERYGANYTYLQMQEFFKDDMKVAIGKDKLASEYINQRSTDFSLADAESAFGIAKSEITKGLVKDKDGNPTNPALLSYVQKRLDILQQLFGDIGALLDDVYKALQSINTNKSVKLLNTMKNKAKKLANTKATSKVSKKNAPSMQALLKIIRNIANGNITRLKDLGDNLPRKMLQAMSEMAYELVVAAAMAHSLILTKSNSEKVIIEALKKGDFEWTGSEGTANKSLGTTDFIFKIGTLKIGFDVKANQEEYTHNIRRNDAMIKLINESLTSSMPKGMVKVSAPGAGNYAELFGYALVNMLTMTAISGSGIEVPNAAQVNISKMKQEIFLPIQKLAVTLGVAEFVDNYLALFDTERRKQVVVLLGDNIIFLTEFMAKINKLVISMLSGNISYGDVGDIRLPSIEQEVKKWEDWVVPQSMIEKLSVDKTELINNLDVLSNGNKSAIKGSIYPSLYNKLDSQMSQIANKVLNKNWQISLRFTFNRVKP